VEAESRIEGNQVFDSIQGVRGGVKKKTDGASLSLSENSKEVG